MCDNRAFGIENNDVAVLSKLEDFRGGAVDVQLEVGADDAANLAL